MGTKLSIIILTILVLLPSALAAGGGGGGGGGGSSSSVSSYADLECDDRGVLSFTRIPVFDTVTLYNTQDDSILSDLPGSWEDNTFTSEEAILRKAGTYVIQDSRYGNKTVECPGLRFSCTLVDISIQQCIRKGKEIQALFTVNNASGKDLKYQFAVPDSSQILVYEQGAYSSELKGLTITPKSSVHYELSVPDAPLVSSLQISHPKCVGQYYVYATADCVTATETAPVQEQSQDLKCGGYMMLEERVRCRLNLREEQAAEYENFFPEECRSWEDKNKCVALYQSVQSCWEFPTSAARISCLKNSVQVGEVAAMKSSCAGNKTCLAALQDKVNLLIKLRFYNLEEAAEEFLEAGQLSTEKVVDFVIKMEQSKIAFNQAQTMEERKGIVLQVRKYWIELIRDMLVEG